MDDAPAHDLPHSNITHANITGKVVKVRVRGRRAGKGKAVRLSPDRRSHVKQLQQRGQISARAATSHGLQGKK